MRFILLTLLSFGILYGAKDSTPPSIPQNVQLVYTDADTILVTWDAATDNVGVVGYRVDMIGSRSSGRSWFNTADLGFTQDGMPQSQVAEYWVRAYDAKGNTSEQSIHVVANPIPSTPQITSIDRAFETTINVYWSASTDLNNGAPSYRLYRNGVFIIQTPPTQMMCPVGMNLTPGQVVTFSVQAVDASGTLSAMSESVSITVGEWPPSFNG